jgi:hypothetical protein
MRRLLAFLGEIIGGLFGLTVFVIIVLVVTSHISEHKEFYGWTFLYIWIFAGGCLLLWQLYGFIRLLIEEPGCLIAVILFVMVWSLWTCI